MKEIWVLDNPKEKGELIDSLKTSLALETGYEVAIMRITPEENQKLPSMQLNIIVKIPDQIQDDDSEFISQVASKIEQDFAKVMR